MSAEKLTEAEILERDKIIKAEKTRLKKLLDDLPESKKKAAEGLTDECAFMRATLKQYREVITSEGLIDIMPQGEYSIVREHPAVKAYNTMVKTYSTVCKQLFDMLPANKKPEPDDDFDSFRDSK